MSIGRACFSKASERTSQFPISRTTLLLSEDNTHRAYIDYARDPPFIEEKTCLDWYAIFRHSFCSANEIHFISSTIFLIIKYLRNSKLTGIIL